MDGELISTIGKGLLVFAAVDKNDTTKEVESMAGKVLKAKFWDGDDGKKWRDNVQDIGGEVLCGAFFSLFFYSHVMATIRVVDSMGNKPSLSFFHYLYLTSQSCLSNNQR